MFLLYIIALVCLCSASTVEQWMICSSFDLELKHLILQVQSVEFIEGLGSSLCTGMRPLLPVQLRFSVNIVDSASVKEYIDRLPGKVGEAKEVISSLWGQSEIDKVIEEFQYVIKNDGAG